MRLPAAAVVFSTTLSLFILGLFGSLSWSAFQIGQYVKSRIKLEAYLDKDLNTQQIAAMQDTIQIIVASSLPQGAEARIELVTKDQAAKRFTEESGEDFVAFLGENPLRDSYAIYLPPSELTSERLESVKAKLVRVPHIHEVTYLQNIATSIQQNLSNALMILGALGLVLILGSALLVVNAVRLDLFARRFVVRSMQLIGATTSFIQKPFLISSMWMGFASGAIASVLVGIVYGTLYELVPDVLTFLPAHIVSLVCLAVILIGVAMATISSYITVRKYLHQSLDRFYL